MALAVRCALRPRTLAALRSAALRAVSNSATRLCITPAAAPLLRTPHASQQRGVEAACSECDVARPPQRQLRLYWPHETLRIALQLGAAGALLPSTLVECKRTVQLLARHATLLQGPLPPWLESRSILSTVTDIDRASCSRPGRAAPRLVTDGVVDH
jgi:hypothetical protein